MKTFFSSKPRKYFNLTGALSCLKADLHMLMVCKLKLNWLSMLIPSSLLMKWFLQHFFLLKTLLVWLINCFLNNNGFKCAGLTIILLSENNLMEFLDSAISISNSNLTDLEDNDGALLSAKLWADVFPIQTKYVRYV